MKRDTPAQISLAALPPAAARELQGLTPRQAAYVQAKLQGLTDEAFCDLMGYASSGSVFAIRTDPRVTDAFRRASAAWLTWDGVSAAISALQQIVKDEKQSGAVRVQAAKTILERAGVEAPARADALAKSVDEMSPDELRSFIAAGEASLANRATPVDATATFSDPVAEQPASEAADFLD